MKTNRSFYALALGLGLILLAGCGGQTLEDSPLETTEVTAGAPEAGDTTTATAPTVSSVTPSDSTTSVAVVPTITVTFDQEMDVTSVGTNSSRSDSVCAGAIQLSSDNFSTCALLGAPSTSDNKSFVFTTRANLTESTTYKVRVSTSAKSSGGTALSSDYTQSVGFTTKDATAPTLSSTSPANSATSVAVNSTLTVTFSEAMDSTTITTGTTTTCSGSVQLSSDGFSTCVAMSSTITANTAKTAFTLTPSANLTGSSTYKIKVTTAAKDAAGNALAAADTQSTGFTTASTADTTAPTVVSVTPIAAASASSITTVVVTFSEAMDTTSISADATGACVGTVYLQKTTGSTCVMMSSTVTASSNTVFTFTLTGSLSANTAYNVVVVGSSSSFKPKDTAGNALATAYTGTTFTTLAVWTTLNTLPTAITNINCIYLSTSGTITCGQGYNGAVFNQLSVYSISGGGWNNPSGPILSAHTVALAATDGASYYYGTGSTDTNGTGITSVYLTSYGSLGTGTLYNHSLATLTDTGMEYIGTTLWTFGGYYSTTSSFLSGVYTLTGGSWSSAGTNMITARASFAHAVIGTKVYLFGGYNGAGYITGSALTTSEVYDTSSYTPTSIAALSTGRSRFCAAVYNSEIYLFGGLTTTNSALDSVLKYSPTSDSYTTKTSLTSARWGHGCATDGTYIYIVGGQSAAATYLNTVERYTPAND